MSAHRPIAHRAFSLLVAFLLVGSLAAAPIAAATGTASTSTTAQDDGGMIDGSFDGTCDSKLRFAFPISCPVGYDYEPLDDGVETSVLKTDMHIRGQALHESQIQTQTTYQNYIEDTETLASLEARDAIATAYENNDSVTAAKADATTAIRDYYAAHQLNILEQMNGNTAELLYYVNTTKQHSDIDDRFFVMGALDVEGSYEYQGSDILSDPVEQEIQLLNGSTRNVTGFEIAVDAHAGSTDYERNGTFNPVTHYNSTSDSFRIPSVFFDDGVNLPGTVRLQSHADAGLESETAYDYRIMMDLYVRLSEQANSVESSYPASLAEEMYAQMDAGEVSPSDVRGAEGMVRYLSGNETDGDSLELALRHALDLDHPESMDSQMIVNFEGETDRQRVTDESGTVSYNYTSVNETYEGLLFASGFPNATAETGVEYNISTFDGTPSILTADGEKRLYSGTMTIQEMYDGNGNSVETMEYSGPEYGTYNSSEFAQALIDAQEERQEIVNEGDDDGGSDISIGWPEDLSGIDGSTAMLGVGLVAIALLAVAGFVLDLIPGLGN